MRSSAPIGGRYGFKPSRQIRYLALRVGDWNPVQIVLKRINPRSGRLRNRFSRWRLFRDDGHRYHEIR